MHFTDSLPSVVLATDPTRRRTQRPRLASALRSALGLATLACAAFAATPDLHAQGVNLALGKTAAALTTEYGLPAFVVDGDLGSRWGSEFNDDESITIDLGEPTAIGRVILRWETAYGSGYTLQVSDDNATWTDLATVTNGDGGVDDLAVSGNGRYLRLQGQTRATGYGYSLWEIEVYAPAIVVPAGDLALGKPYASSSLQFPHLHAGLAFDGDPDTRWSSEFADPQWIRVDLGESYPLSRVVLNWEAACASAYTIEGANIDPSINPADESIWTPIAPAITDGAAGLREIAVSGTYRYVRVHGTARATPWGYSLWSFEVYGDTGGGTPPEDPPVQTTNQTIRLVFPDLAYAKINVSPAPLSVTPTPEEGNTTPSVRNEGVFTYFLTFAPNTTVTLSKNQFSPTQANTDIRLAVTDWSGDALSAQSITTLAVQDAEWRVEIFSTGTGGGDGRDRTIIPDPYVRPASPAINGSFPVNSPDNGALITTTRRPTLAWPAVSGATGYEVFVNVTRNDYDWFAPGSLLDRFTSLGTVTGTSFTFADDLPDRWTYKWYVVASTPGGALRSDLRTFSVYLPHVETRADGVALIGGKRDLNKNGVIDPYENWENPVAARVDDLLGRMTLREKTYQMFFNAYEFPLAGFTFGPLAVEDIQTVQQNSAATRLGIPIIDAGDTIHGYKTSYPIQPGLAAGRDLDTVWEMGDLQRREELAVGSRGTLSPLAEVGTKALYPRIQEGCGEDADLAAGMVRAFVAGLQGGPEVNPHSIWITVKHWPGQGAGGEGGIVYDGTTIHYHMRPWHAAIEAGASGIMPGYAGSWLLGPDGWGAGDDPGIIAYLRDQMGYDGLICSDWLPVGAWIRSANAGSDVMGGANPGEPGSLDAFEAQVSEATIDAAVRRILDIKFRLGLFEDPYRETGAGTAAWHTGENVALARRAARQSMTLLKNDGMLPLRASSGAIVIAGPRADDHEAGAIWRSAVDVNGFGSKSIYTAVKERAEAAGLTVYRDSAPAGTPVLGAIVVVGERSYTHGTEWPTDLPYLPGDFAAGPPHDFSVYPDQFGIIQGFHNQGVPVTTVVYSPRPYVLTHVEAISDALLVIYRPGDEGGPAVAETLFGDNPPSGRLPWQLPRSMAQLGTDNEANQLERWDIPYDLGATEAERALIRAHIAAGEPVPPIYGNPLYQFGAGIQGYGLVDATPPAAFALTAPTNGTVITAGLPLFTWEAASDPETGIQGYEVFIDGVSRGVTKTNAFSVDGGLGNGLHTWQVVARNWAGGATQSPVFTFTLNDTTPPPAFGAFTPAAGATVAAGANTTFIWEQSFDAGSGTAAYTLIVDGIDIAPAVAPTPYVPATVNLSVGANASATSTEFGNANEAIDDNPATRWASAVAGQANPDAQSITLDLGAVYSIKRVELDWEAAYGKHYVIETSLDDGASWQVLAIEPNGDGGADVHDNLAGVGRHVRMRGVERGSGYGYSLWEFRVFGTGTEQATVSGLSSGSHVWQVRATDGAGNTRLSNGPLSFTKQ
jgi:beta-glucosidase